MIFDTDIIIWVQRGNEKAGKAINNADQRMISVYTYMELLQLAPSKKHHKIVKKALKQMGFEVLPITENIGHRAAVYVEEYTLSHHLQAGDAIIAATAVENNLSLLSSNRKHFKCINDLDLKVFRV